MSDRSVGLPPIPRGWLDPRYLRAGARGILPLAIGVFPFGLAYGVAVVASSIDDLAGVLASFLIVAGAAQLAIVDLVDAGAPWFVVVGTSLVINARFIMYSGAMAPSFRLYPSRWRIPLAHVMTDQVAVTSLLYDRRQPVPQARLAYYVGAGIAFVGSWIAGTITGLLIGASVPEELQIGFAVPLMFVALLVPTVRDRPTLAAAAVGFGVTLVAREAPLSTGLLIGTAAGVTFGMLARVRWPDRPVGSAP